MRARLVYRRAVSPTQDPLSSQSALAGDDGGGRFGGWRNLPRRSRGLSLRTLVILRWMAIAGQSATIFVATAWFHFDLPLWGCLAVIAASVAMNLNATDRLRRSEGSVADGTLTAAHLGFDILQLSVLLALTGGLQNPFCLLLVAPVTVAAASLPGRQAALMGLLVLAATVALFFFSMPLPWQAGTELELPPLYRFGVGLALVTGVVFTAAYAWRVAADAEKLELALATTQDVLQREQRLAALGGLAAAAAHELGTPAGDHPGGGPRAPPRLGQGRAGRRGRRPDPAAGRTLPGHPQTAVAAARRGGRRLRRGRTQGPARGGGRASPGLRPRL